MGVAVGSGFMFLVVVFLVGLGAIIAMLRRPTIRVPRNVHDPVVALHRYARAWRLGGLLVGLVAAAVCASLTMSALGRISALAPVALGAGLLLGTIAGELTARPSRGAVRSASLHTRRVGDYVSRGQVLVATGTLALLALVLGFGTLRGSADDQGRAGRALTTRCVRDVPGLGPTEISSTRGPWPGSFYTVPLALGLLVLVLLAVLALRTIVQRPAPDSDSQQLDTVARQAATQNVLSACTVAGLLIVGPLALIMGTMLRADSECATTAAHLGGFGLLMLGALAVGVGLASFGQLLLGPRLVIDDLPRPTPGDAAAVGAPIR
jgi:hypothetical protein